MPPIRQPASVYFHEAFLNGQPALSIHTRNAEQDAGRVGAAWRAGDEKQKAMKRAERLGLTIEGEFDVAAGTAAPHREKPPSESRALPEAAPASTGWTGGDEASAKSDSNGYGKELAAIAMGDYSSGQGPGKVLSMGSGSYVTDMVSFPLVGGRFRRGWGWGLGGGLAPRNILWYRKADVRIVKMLTRPCVMAHSPWPLVGLSIPRTEMRSQPHG